MKISLFEVRKSVNLDGQSIDDIVHVINSKLGGVEEIENLGEKYQGAIIVEVVECEEHPDSDHLHVCRVNDGGNVQVVERDERGLVQVVCGAPNVYAGMKAVWLPPNSVVPSTAHDAEPFVLGARNLRGVMSNGMLASQRELDLSDEHEGIMEVQERCEPGDSFASVYALDDVIIDIENKMFTHRPDCFGEMGVVREVAGIYNQIFISPEWYTSVIDMPERGESLQLAVQNAALSDCPRFQVVAMSDIEIKDSPDWLQKYLIKLGVRPINNVVDVTNYIMLLTGQPTHAYDYDKVAKLSDGDGATIVVRSAVPGETLELLNGKTIEPREQAIMIATNKVPIGLAGVMGGASTEVDERTRNVILEVANFDMYNVRKTSMTHGLFTDAVSRFNKGQSPLQTNVILHKLANLMNELSGAKTASEVIDAKGDVRDNPEIEITVEFINKRLGSSLSPDVVVSLLTNVEFTVEGDKVLKIRAPFWRTDIEIPEDIVEEVGRLYGFDKLPLELPTRTMNPVAKNNKREFSKMIRQSLSRQGANELLTYSFVHENIFTKSEQDVSQAFKLSNALSPDLQYYRLSVLPSLLDKVHPNIKAGHDEFILFELGKGHNKKYHADDDEGLPHESEFVDWVYTSKKPGVGAAFYYVREQVRQLASDLGITVKFEPVTDNPDYPVTAPFELSRSAYVYSYKNHEFLGIIGELKQRVQKQFKLPEYSAAVTLDFEGLKKAHESRGNAYAPLAKYPKVSQDISLKVADNTRYDELYTVVFEAVSAKKPSATEARVELRDIYQAEDADQKTLTFRVEFVNSERTMNDAEVQKVLDGVANAARARMGAEKA